MRSPKSKPSPQQRRWLSQLHTAATRDKDSYAEWSSYPEYTITCAGCLLELKTSDPERAHTHLAEHIGHKGLLLETNVRPDARVYPNREAVLERLANFGKYLVKSGVEDKVVKNARMTYKFIANGGDIEGALQRLTSVCDQRELNDFACLWLRSILNDDQKFISRVTEQVVSRMENEDANR